MPKIKKGRCRGRSVISVSLFGGAETRKKKVRLLSLFYFLFFPFLSLSLFLGLDKNNGEGVELTPWVALGNVKPSLEKTCYGAAVIAGNNNRPDVWDEVLQGFTHSTPNGHHFSKIHVYVYININIYIYKK